MGVPDQDIKVIDIENMEIKGNLHIFVPNGHIVYNPYYLEYRLWGLLKGSRGRGQRVPTWMSVGEICRHDILPYRRIIQDL
jgi:hypothetical protein